MAQRGRRGQHDRALGAWGEDVACRHLTGLGWQVIERNWRCPTGEIDVVAFDPHARAVVFVEVKTRAGEGYGHPLEAITWAKQNKLRELAMAWIHSHDDRPPGARVRIDAVGVLWRGEREPRIDHVVGATR